MTAAPGSNVIYSTLATDEDVAELVEMFVVEVPQRMESLQKAAEQKDWESVERYAHQLKGALGSYGFGTVMPFAQDLEMATKDHLPPPVILQALQGLGEMCSRIQAGFPNGYSH